LSRVINPNTAGKERDRLVKAIVIALRELGLQSADDAQTRDLAAFMVLSLESIAETIDLSVQAWEKRGYWVKADRYRMDWIWTSQYGQELRRALLADDWANVAMLLAKIGGKLSNVKAPRRNRIGQPWVGAWQKLIR
jgi:hypothetical protein